MKRLKEIERARILMAVMRIANLQTTLEDAELVITEIERILIEEGTIKVKK